MGCVRKLFVQCPLAHARLLTAVASVTAGICAAQAQSGSVPSVLDRVIVTASTLELTAASASQHITVITREELIAAGYASVADALAMQAGLVIDRGARSGAYGSLYLRGADPSHVVILIDQVRQNDPLSSRGSAVDLNTLTLDDVERIEIVRGNVSVVHGEALAGMIHITTRIRSQAETRVAAQVGGDGLRKLSAAAGTASFHVSATHSEDGNTSTGASRTRALNLGWHPALADGHGVEIRARVADADSRGFPDDSGGERYAIRRTLDAQSAQTAQLSTRSWLQLGSAGKIELLVSHFSRDGRELNPGISPGVRDPAGFPPVTTDSRYRRQQVQSLWRPMQEGPFRWVIGAEYQREAGSFDSLISFGPRKVPARFEATRDTTSVFTETRYQLDGWTAQAGLRYQSSGSEGDALHPAASLHRTLGDAMGQIGMSTSSATKLPSFYALGHPLIGNPSLRPEGGQQREIFYVSAPESPIPVRVTLFSARYSDLVDFDAGPPPRLVNRTRINVDGVEWSASHTTAAGVTALLDGSWMRVRDPDGQTTLRSRPHAQLGGQARLPLPGQSQFALAVRYIGLRLDSAIPTGDVWLPGYTLINVLVSKQISARVRATLALDNLLNRRVDEAIGTPLGGRRIRFAITWSL